MTYFSGPIFGLAAAMFFAFAGVAANQFHGYLFEIKGCDAISIGVLLMTGYAAAVVAPLLQILLIRKCDGPYKPLMVVSLGAAISLALLPHATGFWALWWLFLAMNFCVASAFPLLMATALDAVRGQGHGMFVRLRGLGTVGFLVACLICLAFPKTEKLPLIYACFGGGFLLSMLALIPTTRKHHLDSLTRAQTEMPAPRLAQAWRRLFRGETSVLLILLAAMNFANVMATAVQGNYLIHRFHLDQRSISLAWVVSTICEIGWMFLCARLIRAMDIRRIMLLGLWGTLIKLALLAWATTYVAYVVGLAFHGLYFSFTLAGFGVYLDRRYRRSERPALQALTSSLVQGVPAALAGITSGLLWHRFQLHSVYLVSALLAALTCVFAEVWARRRRVYFQYQGDR